MNEIDIRDSKLKGDELKKLIIEAVKSTQELAVTTLPDKLIMTKKQFEMLSGDMLGVYNPDGTVVISSTERVYITPHNAMDVVVR